jgi:hypothetical protein
MSCTISKGRLVPCKDKIGGLYKIWFTNYNTVTPLVDGTLLSITGLTGATAPTLYQYDLKGTSTLSQEMVSSAENGTTVVTQTLTLDLQGGDQATNNEIKLIAYGRPQVFVQDNYGSVWYVGRFRGMDLTSAVLTTGAALADKYGYTITLVGQENAYAEQVYGSTITNAWAGLTTGTPTIVLGV